MKGGKKPLISLAMKFTYLAQWLERWCASLVARVRFLACLVQIQLLQGEPEYAAAIYPFFIKSMFMIFFCLRNVINLRNIRKTENFSIQH